MWKHFFGSEWREQGGNWTLTSTFPLTRHVETVNSVELLYFPVLSLTFQLLYWREGVVWAIKCYSPRLGWFFLSVREKYELLVFRRYRVISKSVVKSVTRFTCSWVFCLESWVSRYASVNGNKQWSHCRVAE